jgi:hypothetical protein
MRIASVLVALLLMVAPAAWAADILTTADLEKAGGLRGLQTVAKNPAKGAGGELNFADPAGKLVAMVMIQPLSTYEFWKKQYGKNADLVAQVGDEAFCTKPKEFISWVIFRKGNTGVWIQSMGFKAGGAANYTSAQLTELAKIAASRM